MEFFKILLVFAMIVSMAVEAKRGKVKDREALSKVAKGKKNGHAKSVWAINELASEEDFLEGDIKIDPKLEERLKQGKGLGRGKNKIFKRNAVMYRTNVWRTRKIPYVIDSQLSQSAKNAIAAAVSEINAINPGCLQWVSRTTESYYVKFVREDGCWSYVGNVAFSVGFQKISIGFGCEYKGTVMHEMYHAMGFFHEQSRSDRDSYVTVNWANIQSDSQSQFKIQSVADLQGIGYDLKSVMHYGKTAFSVYPYNLVTIQAKNDPTTSLGGDSLTNSDTSKLTKLYDCATASGWSAWPPFGPCTPTSWGNLKYRYRFCISENLSECSGATAAGFEFGYQYC